MDAVIKALQGDKVSLLFYQAYPMLMENSKNSVQMTKPPGLLNNPESLWQVTLLT